MSLRSDLSLPVSGRLKTALVVAPAACVVAGLALTGSPAVAAPAPAWTLSPTSQGYLGTTSGVDRHNGVAVQPGGVLAVGGRVGSAGAGSSASLGVRPRVLLGGTTGTVIRLAPGGRRVLSVTRVGSEVEGIAADAKGNLAVVGAFGVALLDPAASKVRWRVAVGAAGGMTDSPGRRISIAADGTVAVLANKRVTVYSVAGKRLGVWALGNSWANDVAIDARTRSVFVTGFDQAERNLQVAYLYAYDYAGKRRWRNYNWTPAQVGGLRSDTRGYRVAMGADGRLYFAGESAGGTSIFHRHPRNVGADAKNTIFDPFNHPYNTGSNHIAYYSRLDPRTGAFLAGQWMLTRLGPNKGNRGNSIFVRSLAADEAGNVYVGGEAACCLEHRKDAMSIAGKRVPPYGGDFYVLVASADLKKRRTWVAFGGKGESNGVAARGGVAAVVGAATAPGTVVHRAVHARPAASLTDNAPDGFVSTWPTGVAVAGS